MIYKAFFLFLLVVGNLKSEAQVVLGIQQQLNDLELLKSNLEQFHPGLYRYTSKDSMDYFFQKAVENIEDQSVTAFYAEVTRLLNKVRCGHTRSRLPDEVYRSYLDQQQFMPFTVASLGNRFVIDEVFNDEQFLSRGDEIRSVNGQPVFAIAKKIESHLSADGFITTGIRKQTARFFNFYYPLYVEPTVSCYALEICGKDGILTEVNVNGQPWSTLQKPQTDEPVLSLTYSSGYAVLRFKTFDSGSISQEGFSYAEFLDQSFEELGKKKIENLILDLRGNGGGDDNYGATLVSYFAKKPFRYFDRIEVTDAYDGYGKVIKKNGWNLMTSHQGLGEWQPQPNRFVGSVYVLIDGWSFSTCADVATVLHHHQWATFIGEETGGGYDGNTSGYSKRLELPNSKINVNIPMWKYTTANEGHLYPGRGVQPDYSVYPSIRQFIDGIDPEMDKAIEVINNKE